MGMDKSELFIGETKIGEIKGYEGLAPKAGILNLEIGARGIDAEYVDTIELNGVKFVKEDEPPKEHKPFITKIG